MAKRDVTVFLLKERTSLEQVFDDAVKVRKHVKPLTIRNPLAGFTTGYVVLREPRVPSWRDWMDPVYKLSPYDVSNQTCGLVGVLGVCGRFFAIVFGRASSCLNQDAIEREFGLIVALQCVPVDSFQRLVSKTLGVQGKQNDRYLHGGGGIAEFDVDVGMEWIRGVSGRVGEEKERLKCVSLVGSDSVRLRGYTESALELKSTCRALFELFDRGVPDALGFVKHLRRLDDRGDAFKELENKFRNAVETDDDEVAIEFVLDAQVARHSGVAKIATPKSAAILQKDGALSDISTAALLQTIRQTGVKKRMWLEYGPQEERLRLLDMLHAEVSWRGKTYLRVDGAWFLAEPEFQTELNRRIEAIPRNDMDLPPWEVRGGQLETEPTYLSRVGSEHLVVQDRKLLKSSGLELCDVLRSDGTLICIKRGESSAKISHLGAQISGAAQALRFCQEDREEFRQRFANAWPNGEQPGLERIEFVAAIPARADDLFGKKILARVAIAMAAAALARVNFKFSISRIATSERSVDHETVRLMDRHADSIAAPTGIRATPTRSKGPGGVEKRSTSQQPKGQQPQNSQEKSRNRGAKP